MRNALAYMQILLMAAMVGFMVYFVTFTATSSLMKHGQFKPAHAACGSACDWSDQ